MQATSSQVIPATPEAPMFVASGFDDLPSSIIPVALKKAARDSGRDHLLVRRRRRDTRRAAR